MGYFEEYLSLSGVDFTKGINTFRHGKGGNLGDPGKEKSF